MMGYALFEALANKHTLNWDSDNIRTRRRIEPRASRFPVENFAMLGSTRDHSGPNGNLD